MSATECPPIVEIVDVRKSYQVKERIGWFRSRRYSVHALAGVSLQIRRGELFGLLGPNGAGKTTLIKCLTTLLLPSSGQIRVDGFDAVAEPRRVAARLGCMLLGERGLYWKLTGRENLEYFAALYFIPASERGPAIKRLIDRLDVGAFIDRPVESYSSGQRIKVAFARALIGDAPVMVLDEPTNALDVHAARELRQLVQELHQEGRTVIFSTHLLAEAEKLCQRVAIIDRGKVVVTGVPAELVQEATGDRRIQMRGGFSPGLIVRLKALSMVRRVRPIDDPSGKLAGFEITCRDPQRVIVAVLAEVSAAGGHVAEIEVERPSLEDLFVQLTPRHDGAPAPPVPPIPPDSARNGIVA